jgi:uncharacterized membrane-anchored protein
MRGLPFLPGVAGCAKLLGMPNATLAEIYFVSALMLLVTVISIVSIYIFMRTYKKEMREKEERKRDKAAAEQARGLQTGLPAAGVTEGKDAEK